MKFDQMINYIAESTLETEVNAAYQEWREQNPKLAATPSAYFHFTKGRTDDNYTPGGRGRKPKQTEPDAATDFGDEPVTPNELPDLGDDEEDDEDDLFTPDVEDDFKINIPDEIEVGVKYKELPDTKRTKQAVAEILQINPAATFEDVLAAMLERNSDETPLNLDTAVIKAAMEEIQGGGAGEVGEEEPDLGSLKKTELADKYEKMRQALYKHRGFDTKSAKLKKIKDIVDDEDAEDEIDDLGSGVDMSDEPIDPLER